MVRGIMWEAVKRGLSVGSWGRPFWRTEFETEM